MLGVPEDAGPDRAVSRAIEAYRSERGNKKEVATLYYSMVMAGSLPWFGASSDWTRTYVTHETLAGMHGVRRETVTWRLMRCSKGRNRWDDKPDAETGETRRQKRSREESGRAAAQGKQVHNRALRSLEAANGEIFHVTPNFNYPNTYQGPSGVNGPLNKTARLLVKRFGEDVFDPQARCNGFKVIFAWLWHPALPDPVECECQAGQDTLAFQQVCPKCGGQGWHYREPSKLEKKRGLRYGSLPDYARRLASWYLMQGIEDEIPEIRGADNRIVRRRSPAGMLQVRQSDKARSAGMDEDTVRKMDWKLQKLLIVNIVEGEKEYWPGTHKVKSSEPDKTIWMPSRLLDHDICVREMERFIQARQALQGNPWLARAEALHLELLKTWEGKPHSLAAFWNELRRRFAHAGIPKDVRATLLPDYRE
jgi:hypothetical protein